VKKNETREGESSAVAAVLKKAEAKPDGINREILT
jgi:hypothetical protein